MGKLKTLGRILKEDRGALGKAIASNISTSRLSHILSDKAYVKLIYRLYIGKKLNLKDPKTFNEKLQWLKLYDRKPEYTRMVDKYEAKRYVAELIGEEYIIPTLGVWDRVEDIDFDTLPEQFVLKCTHDSGSVVICRDKSNFDAKKAMELLEKKLKSNLFWHGREWPYKNLNPRIIAEEYMEDKKTAELRDYKFFCFNGEVKALFVAVDRQKSGEEVKFDFFDSDFNWLPFKQGHPHASVRLEKPVCFEEMKNLASKLSAGIPHVRVDFYEVNGKIYFGEMTFFHFCGIIPFEPEEWDYKFGEWIKLPQQK